MHVHAREISFFDNIVIRWLAAQSPASRVGSSGGCTQSATVLYDTYAHAAMLVLGVLPQRRQCDMGGRRCDAKALALETRLLMTPRFFC